MGKPTQRFLPFARVVLTSRCPGTYSLVAQLAEHSTDVVLTDVGSSPTGVNFNATTVQKVA